MEGRVTFLTMTSRPVCRGGRWVRVDFILSSWYISDIDHVQYLLHDEITKSICTEQQSTASSQKAESLESKN